MERGMPLRINDQVNASSRPGAGGFSSPMGGNSLMGYPLGWTDPDCDEPEPWPGWPAMMGEGSGLLTSLPVQGKIPDRAKRLKAPRECSCYDTGLCRFRGDSKSIERLDTSAM